MPTGFSLLSEIGVRARTGRLAGRSARAQGRGFGQRQWHPSLSHPRSSDPCPCLSGGDTDKAARAGSSLGGHTKKDKGPSIWRFGKENG